MDEKNGNHWRCPLCGGNRCDIDRAAIGGAAAGLDFLIDQEKNFQDKYNWGDSEEIWDDTEQLPEELDESDEVKEQLNGERQYE